MIPHVVRFLYLTSVAALAMVIGTDRLGRAATDEEKRAFERVLREHDFAAASRRALLFAQRLAGTPSLANELLGRVHARLVRQGWDPGRVSLAEALCRFTWSEWRNFVRERRAARDAQDGYGGELEATSAEVEPSMEDVALDAEARAEAQRSAQAKLDALRAAFVAAGDAVNIEWLDATRDTAEGLPDLQQLAAATGRDVAEFYAAAKRRKRAVLRLLSA